MAEKRPKRPLITTPKGRFKYPHLVQADTEFDAAGRFHVQLVVPEEDAAPLIRKLAPEHKEAIAAARLEYEAMSEKARKKIVFNPQDFYEAEEETGEPTGNVIVKFGTKATLKVKDRLGNEQTVQRVIPIYDAKGQRISGDTELSIWGGTLGKVSFFTLPYFIPGSGLAGLTLRLAAVQVIELVSGGAASAERYGFGSEEGFEYQPPKDPGPAHDTDESLDDEIPF